MKIKLLIMVLFMALAHTHAMDVIHSASPKIEKCSVSHCNKDTQNRCNGCRVFYYCSKECQTGDWRSHKKICKAYQSDIGHLRTAFHAFFNAALETKEPRHIKQAISLHTQTLVRIDQDNACTFNKNISSLEMMQEGQGLLSKLIAHNVCTLRDAQTMLRQEVPAAIALVKQRTLDDKLVAPYGITNYEKENDGPAESDSEKFIPEKEWKETRLATIAEYEQKFKPENL